MLYMEVICKIKKTKQRGTLTTFRYLSTNFRYFMATFRSGSLDMTLDGVEDEALVFSTAGPKQKKAWWAYAESILVTQCVHLIFMDVMHLFIQRYFLAFLFPHNILREYPTFWDFLQ